MKAPSEEIYGKSTGLSPFV